MQAVILAAGMGKRLQSLTSNSPKCMVEVNGITLIERALRILDKKNLSRIVIVVGYKKKVLLDFIENLHIGTPVIFVDNDEYEKTNNIYSLFLAKDYLVEESTLLLESDIIFEENIIDDVLNDKRETLAVVDKFASWMDGTCMEVDENDSILEFIPGKYLKFEEKDKYYKTVNIYKFSKEFLCNVYLPFLEAYLGAMGVNEYYESVIKLIAMLDNCNIKAKRLSGQIWYEIDDIQDLDIACTLFAGSDELKYKAIASRYGGYWRYPSVLDFCYLVNPFFPSKRMLGELKSNFDTLITQYPSGMRVNSMLAAKNFGVQQEHIVIGNGAAELIQVFMEMMSGTMGMITPTFEEYHHRFAGNLVEFTSPNDDFHYSVDDIIKFFDNEDNHIDHLVLINPDNPSGNFISKKELFKLIGWCKKKKITLIIDESFVDFVDDNDALEETLIAEDVLDMYSDLFIVKSISKSYGIPGLRIGVLASSNENVIQILKKNVAIWNINSLAEFFMQILGKYKKEYMNSLCSVRTARRKLISDLNNIENICAYESQGNYVLCEIRGITSRQLSHEMLRRNILIKDLSEKVKNGKEYVRIAVRNPEDNNMLINCLRKVLEPYLLNF
ncbi:MAG: aminotransferase class I/II-fold pyridoxal phosphate-dependent enzyme [Lachnospiraceae bacterium]|nr:aminotransferase class I/II-fold pyridoxal phosphate-dependent enzyme [Lachnospiraceae bacterium]